MNFTLFLFLLSVTGIKIVATQCSGSRQAEFGTLELVHFSYDGSCLQPQVRQIMYPPADGSLLFNVTMIPNKLPVKRQIVIDCYFELKAGGKSLEKKAFPSDASVEPASYQVGVNVSSLDGAVNAIVTCQISDRAYIADFEIFASKGNLSQCNATNNSPQTALTTIIGSPTLYTLCNNVAAYFNFSLAPTSRGIVTATIVQSDVRLEFYTMALVSLTYNVRSKFTGPAYSLPKTNNTKEDYLIRIKGNDLPLENVYVSLLVDFLECPLDTLDIEGSIVLGREYSNLRICNLIPEAYPIPFLSARPVLLTVISRTSIDWRLEGLYEFYNPSSAVEQDGFKKYLFYPTTSGAYKLTGSNNDSRVPEVAYLKLEYIVDSCPEAEPYKCEGKCVRSLDTCRDSTIICPDNMPFKCNNGTCVSAPLLCASGTCGVVECWNGACVQSLLDCPLLPECPSSRPLRCENGCFLSNATCPTIELCSIGTIQCADGYCRDTCPEYNGCNLNEIHCGDGSCVQLESECTCFNASCQPPTTKKPFPIQTTFDPSEALNVPIVSSNFDETLCYVDIPQGVLVGFSTSVFVVDQVPSSLLRRINNSTQFFTPPLSLSFILNVEDVTFQKNVTITCIASGVQNVSNLCLAFIDKNQKWSCVDYDLVEQRNGSQIYLSGSTNHFTDFAVLLGEREDVDDGESNNNNNNNKDEGVNKGLIIGVVVGAIAFIIIGIVVGVFVANKRRNEEEADMQLNEQPSSQNYEMH